MITREWMEDLNKNEEQADNTVNLFDKEAIRYVIEEIETGLFEGDRPQVVALATFLVGVHAGIAWERQQERGGL